MEMVMMIDERIGTADLHNERKSEAAESGGHEIVPGEDRDDEIVALHNQGLTVIEIAKRLGWPTQKVSHRVRMCRKYGLIEKRTDPERGVGKLWPGGRT